MLSAKDMNKKPLVYLAVAALSLTACLDEKADQPSNPPPSTPKGAVSKVLLLGDDEATAFACFPVAVQALGADGGAIIAEADTTVTLTATGSGDFYDNEYCGTGDITSVTIPADAQNAVVYFKTEQQGSLTLNGEVGGTTGTAWTKSLAGPNITQIQMVRIGANSDCARTSIQFSVGSVLTPVSDTQPATITVVSTGAGFGGFFLDSDTSCSGTALTAITLPAGATNVTVRRKANTSPVTHNHTISYSTPSHGSGSGYTATTNY